MNENTLFDVRSLYILKDGVPVFHWHYINDKELNIEKEEKDSVLISGFLSAIVVFANEIGIGEPKSYLTDDIKFSFLNKNGFLFVISIEKDIPDEQAYDFLNIVSKTFIKLYDVGDFHNLQAINFDEFKEYLFEIIKKFNIKNITNEKINEDEIIKEIPNKSNIYKNLIPKCYIDLERNKHFSSLRRTLFKLIDGNISIYNIAQKMNYNPQDIYYTLRSYEKFGYIQIKKIDNNEES
ncbi:MAG: hypothetical protein ACTSYZ_14655 [Candidatus Helarchaeota archaeon]